MPKGIYKHKKGYKRPPLSELEKKWNKKNKAYKNYLNNKRRCLII